MYGAVDTSATLGRLSAAKALIQQAVVHLEFGKPGYSSTTAMDLLEDAVALLKKAGYSSTAEQNKYDCR